MTIEFKNYTLREPINEDTKGLIEITHDREAMKYYGTTGSFLKTEDDALRQINWMKEQFIGNAGRWTITEKGRNQYIGDIGFHNHDKKHNRIEIGFRLCRKFWGQGIVSNFISLLLQYAFGKFDYNRIEALVDTRNEGSKRVLLKNNFIRDGILREYELEYGQYVDLEMYSLLRRDYFK